MGAFAGSVPGAGTATNWGEKMLLSPPFRSLVTFHDPGRPRRQLPGSRGWPSCGPRPRGDGSMRPGSHALIARVVLA